MVLVNVSHTKIYFFHKLISHSFINYCFLATLFIYFVKLEQKCKNILEAQSFMSATVRLTSMQRKYESRHVFLLCFTIYLVLDKRQLTLEI